MKTLKITKFIVLPLLIFTIGLLLTASPQGQKTPNKTVLTNCTVIDCTGNSPLENMSVVIEGNTITDILRGAYTKSANEKNVRVLDLENGAS